jgi:hypothetical protein
VLSGALVGSAVGAAGVGLVPGTVQATSVSNIKQTAANEMILLNLFIQ